MSEMQIDGKEYISSKRASEISGYAQDYIGQLARKGLIDARRIGGLWYVLLDSLQTYKKKADEYKPEPPQRPETQPEPSTLVFFDGKEYVSAARAAEMTGYAQDYVGQLARSGTILSRQVGNRWYVERGSILSHKRDKDALLAAVQSESVGLVKPATAKGVTSADQVKESELKALPLLQYFNESGDLLPITGKETADPELVTANDIPAIEPETTLDSRAYSIPIRRGVQQKDGMARQIGTMAAMEATPVRNHSGLRGLPALLGAAATIIIVISIGYASLLRQNSVYATNVTQFYDPGSLSAAAATAFSKIGDVLEPFLTRELVYVRPDSQ